MPSIQYVKDIITASTRLTSKGRPEHWLHPIHGPAPDLIGQLSYGPDHFIAAVWVTPLSFIVMLELIERRTAPTNTRGGILQSFRWTIDGDRLINKWNESKEDALEIHNVDEIDEWGWRCEIYRQLMVKSVKLTVTTSIGGYRNDEYDAFTCPTLPK